MKPSNRYMLMGAVVSVIAIALVAGGGFAAYQMFKEEPTPVATAPTKPAPKQYVKYQQTSQQGVIHQKPPCEDGNILGTLAGGAAGGIIGNQIGSGSGKTVATIGGAVGGAYLGREHIPLNGSTCR